MRITGIEICNLCSIEYFDSDNISPGINILVGPNNSGKSAFIHALYWMFNHETLSSEDRRVLELKSSVQIKVANWSGCFQNESGIKEDTKEELSLMRRLHIEGNSSFILKGDKEFREFSNKFPYCPCYPFLSTRKSREYEHTVGDESARTIAKDFRFINAQIDRVLSGRGAVKFKDYCQEIFGLEIGAFPFGKGKHAGFLIDDNRSIGIDRMGSGTAHILALIAALSSGDDKIYLIEEPETEIHPAALKQLLKLIVERSEKNQFFITTHSHIVLQYLGGLSESNVYRVSLGLENNIPKSTYTLLEDADQRQEVLYELGYDLRDFGLYEAWLILEESSAERIIMEFLIPWFVPGLIGRIRTLAAWGVGDVKKRLSELMRLMTFLHLTPIYRERCWVIVDGGDEGEKCINELNSSFKDWKAERFIMWNVSDFEHYYPARFKERISASLNDSDKSNKRNAKKQLLEEVVDWARKHNEEARKEFALSAQYAIERLREIEHEVLKKAGEVNAGTMG